MYCMGKVEVAMLEILNQVVDMQVALLKGFPGCKMEITGNLVDLNMPMHVAALVLHLF